MMLALTRHTGEAFQLSEMPRKNVVLIRLIGQFKYYGSSMSLLDFIILKGFLIIIIYYYSSQAINAKHRN